MTRAGLRRSQSWGGARAGAGRKPAGQKRLKGKGTLMSLKRYGKRHPDGHRNVTGAYKRCLQKVEDCFAQLRELTGASTNSEMLVIAAQHPSLGVSITDAYAQLAATRSEVE